MNGISATEHNRIMAALDKPMTIAQRIEAIKAEAVRARVVVKNRAVMRETLRKLKEGGTK
jgi:hypothetical protein